MFHLFFTEKVHLPEISGLILCENILFMKNAGCFNYSQQVKIQAFDFSTSLMCLRKVSAPFRGAL